MQFGHTRQPAAKWLIHLPAYAALHTPRMQRANRGECRDCNSAIAFLCIRVFLMTWALPRGVERRFRRAPPSIADITPRPVLKGT